MSGHFCTLQSLLQSCKVLLCGGFAFVNELMCCSSLIRIIGLFSKNKHDRSRSVADFLTRVFVQHVSEVTRSIPHNKERVKLVAPAVSSSLVKRRRHWCLSTVSKGSSMNKCVKVIRKQRNKQGKKGKRGFMKHSWAFFFFPGRWGG